MANLYKTGKLILIAGMVGMMGCDSVNRATAKLDMAGAHMGEYDHPEFEGRIVTAKRIGDMTSIQFVGGRYFDVESASPGLVPGDTVRIYRTETGLEAHLWKAAPEPDLSSKPTFSDRHGS
jgi:hypothetical protein